MRNGSDSPLAFINNVGKEEYSSDKLCMYMSECSEYPGVGLYASCLNG